MMKVLHEAYGPEEIINRFAGQISLEKISIRGRVIHHRSGNKTHDFLDIEEFGRKIQVQVPKTDVYNLSVDQLIVVYGTLKTIVSNEFGLRLTVYGRIIFRDENSAIPKLSASSEVVSTNAYNRSILDPIDFFRHYKLSEILLIGSARGIKDFQTAFSSESNNTLKSIQVNVTCEKSILNAIDNTIYQGVIIVRGGSADDGGMGLWKDISFVCKILNLNVHLYPGIGHSDDQTLLDKYADRSFPTPSIAGSIMGKSFRRAYWEKRTYGDFEQKLTKKDTIILRLSVFIICLILLLMYLGSRRF